MQVSLTSPAIRKTYLAALAAAAALVAYACEKIERRIGRLLVERLAAAGVMG